MLSKKLFMLMHKIALFAIVFASLAPSVSQAVAAQNGTNSFSQAICSSSGKTISIQVLTTKGQLLVTEFVVKKLTESSPKSISMHLEHCPFCSAGVAATLPENNLTIIALLEAKAQKVAEYAEPIAFSNTYKTPPSHAPPSL